MREKVISADTIDAAVEGILDELKNTSRKENVIYFDGWDGLGASAVLRAVAQRLALKEPARPAELKFEQVIHVDCSKWENTRTVQRKIAEQLKLPNRVMEMLDKQDEEDDFNGITDQGSRIEITDVAAEIQRSIQDRRFLLVLHNGSNEEIDISRIGLSVYEYFSNKVIWTFQGRFRMDPKMINIARNSTKTDVLLSASCSNQDPQELWSYLLREEATEVASKHGIDPAILVECFLYMLTLYCAGRHPVDTEYDLATHTCNYWICDGLIHKVRGSIGEAWKVSDALQGEMRLDMDYYHNELPSHLVRYAESIPHWTSPTFGFVLVPLGVTHSGMFKHFDKLGVLKLSRCTFSFSSPPFLCCRILRFLWLHHCQDLRSTYAEKREEEEDTTRSWACFQSLWVLDLRYTDWDLILSAQVMDLMTELRELNVMGAKNWDMSHLRGRLRNIRKLRITKSTCCFNNNVFSEMESMELLDFSGNNITQGMTSLSGPAGSGSLETVIIDGCDGLKTISFRDCTPLKNLVLKGLFRDLEELDLSGTRVKTLNLGEMEAPSLDYLILLGCEKLVAMKWPSEKDRLLNMLRIDTTSTSASADGSEVPHSHPPGDRFLQQQKEEKFNQWQISLMDARFLRSISLLLEEKLVPACLHIDIYPAATLGDSNVQRTSIDKLVVGSKYIDVSNDGPTAAMTMWDCPEIPVPYDWTCIIKVITPGQGNKLLEDAQSASTSALLLPPIICDYRATSLHVYDNSSITSIPAPPGGSKWTWLRWCRVERCPKLHTLFPTPTTRDYRSFHRLETFWGSQLLTTRYIWDDVLENRHCRFLTFLHLDCCPRLIHVLPMSMHRDFRYDLLVTLEIVCCGDLRKVFPLVHEHQNQDTVEELNCPKLKHIHLYELPMLQHICRRRISAPKLETIKIRGCWSLRSLPAIGSDTEPPMVDCEKEWWDNLEWDGVEVYHHPSLYEPSHSSHYKKAQLPRGTLLR